MIKIYFRSILIVICAYGLIPAIFAQTWNPQLQPPEFIEFTGADGLSQSGINCMLHDSRGFMWIGTQDGLNRYDGYQFTVFKHVDGDSRSLSHNWVWALHEDENSDLWIGTFGGGLNHFDRQTETFTVYRQQSQASDMADINSPRDFLQLDPIKLWMGLDVGFASFNSENKQFTHYRPTEQRNYIQLDRSDEGNLLLMLPAAMAFFDPSSEIYQERTFNLPEPMTGHLMTCTAPRRSGGLWIGSNQGAVFSYDPAQHRLQLATQVNPLTENSGQQVNYLLEDSEGVLWIGTSTGIYLYRANIPESLIRLQHSADQPQSISHNLISIMYENRHGEMWVGTRKGLNMFSRSARKFAHLKTDENNPGSLSNSNVLPIFEDRQQDIWIGTVNGLNRLNPDDNSFEKYFAPGGARTIMPGVNYLLSIGQDSSGALWLGTRGSGAHRFDPATNEFTHFPFISISGSDNGTISQNVNSIYCTRDGTLWLGSGGRGLNRYQPQTADFFHYRRIPGDSTAISNNWIFAMLEDREGNFWVGTAAGGLNLFDRRQNRFYHFLHDPDNPASISNNMVLCLFQARDGDFWVGTANGLNKMTVTPSADGGLHCTFQRYFEQDGLPNNVIYGILEDDQQRLWISTNHGITRMSKTGEETVFRHFDRQDGLQSNEFNQNAYLKASDGRFYFGGINGLNWFFPDSIQGNPHKPPVIISDFKIFNESVPVEVDSAATNTHTATRLKKAISETRSINLSWRDKVFSFEFAALNFTHPQQNRYAYRLQGFDRDWIYSGNRRFVTYTNLDPGNYEFQVKASNNDGLWNENARSISISIAPPPWRTWWAYLLYLIAISAALAGIVRFQINKNAAKLEALARIERARIEERERVRKQSSADFHDEAGNLITKINLYLELTRRNLAENSRISEYINHIEDNTRALSGGMRDFIWVLDPDQDSLFDTVQRLQQFGNSMFADSDTHFSVKGLQETFKKSLLPPKDRRAIVLIFKEAINNCLKYSQASQAKLSIVLDGNRLSISLEDDGVGFGENTGNGYGLKNMQNRAEKIGATLTIDSTPDKGTRITLAKPI